MNRTLTIVGASVRAAAQSALCAGYAVVAGDMFADADLARNCQAKAVKNYPQGLADVVAGPQAGAWMYTGALENSPQLVAAMAAVRPLLGNDAMVLRRVRDPWLVSQALRSAGHNTPQLAAQEVPPPRGGVWLCKPLESAGGSHIVRWNNEVANHAHRSRATYFQQAIAGTACSAVYVAANEQAALLGVTRQLVGETWCGTTGFRYCGSIGPLELPPAEHATFEALGHCLARCFNLQGLFGVDAIVNERGIWPIEVNPRYTASCEIFDRSWGQSTVAMHVDACRAGRLPCRPFTPARLYGKAIVFAERRVIVGREIASVDAASLDEPEVADIPRVGATVEAGWPVITVLAEGREQHQVITRLRERARHVQDCLVPVEVSPAH